MKLTILKGHRFDLLTVIEELHQIGVIRVFSLRCDCGNNHVARLNNLRSGMVGSCGCRRIARIKETNTKHSESSSREYITWASMNARCYNHNNTRYASYGGRGIEVCERWKDFSSFLHDMGRKPFSNASLDRVDCDGDYSKENCRWADTRTQCNNRRKNVRLTLNGETKTATEWSRLSGLDAGTIRFRVRSGWSDEKTLTTAVGSVKYSHSRKKTA